MGRDENLPITLEEACRLVFSDAFTPSTLRSEAAKGNLEIARIGRRDFTTLRSAKELFAKCRALHLPDRRIAAFL